jgi:hypothetical protein
MGSIWVRYGRPPMQNLIGTIDAGIVIDTHKPTWRRIIISNFILPPILHQSVFLLFSSSLPIPYLYNIYVYNI